MTFETIVRTYIRDHRDDARDEMRFFKDQPSLVEAIRNAARPGGQKHSHQYRIPPALLDEAEHRLKMAATELAHAPDFDALHCVVDRKIGCISGIGPLTVYDLAHRIGAFLGKIPVLVYLHSGTKTGAAVLGFSGAAIHPNVLPAAFSVLSAAEIEDCLCLYKDQLHGRAIRTGHMQRVTSCNHTAFRPVHKC